MYTSDILFPMEQELHKLPLDVNVMLGQGPRKA